MAVRGSASCMTWGLAVHCYAQAFGFCSLKVFLLLEMATVVAGTLPYEHRQQDPAARHSRPSLRAFEWHHCLLVSV